MKLILKVDHEAEKINMNSVLSVVIPIHNSEKYIDSCVESILKQTYKELDIILVDNNSKDKSVAKCEKFCGQDSRISFLTQNIPGAAVTRNKGIENAKGDYITFVDSDDYLDKEAYQTMMDKMIEENSDAVICSYHIVDEEGKELGWYEPEFKKYTFSGPISGKEACKIFLTSRDIEGFGWNKIFKRDMLECNGLRFEENKAVFEDMVFVFKLLSKCERVSFVEQKFYFYRQHTSSLVHQEYNVKRVSEYEDTMNEIKKCAIELGLEKEVESSIIYRNALLDYSHGCSRAFNMKTLCKELFSILRYQRTEKVKTILKILILYIRRK